MDMSTDIYPVYRFRELQGKPQVFICRRMQS